MFGAAGRIEQQFVNRVVACFVERAEQFECREFFGCEILCCQLCLQQRDFLAGRVVGGRFECRSFFRGFLGSFVQQQFGRAMQRLYLAEVHARSELRHEDR